MSMREWQRGREFDLHAVVRVSEHLRDLELLLAKREPDEAMQREARDQGTTTEILMATTLANGISRLLSGIKEAWLERLLDSKPGDEFVSILEVLERFSNAAPSDVESGAEPINYATDAGLGFGEKWDKWQSDKPKEQRKPRPTNAPESLGYIREQVVRVRSGVEAAYWEEVSELNECCNWKMRPLKEWVPIRQKFGEDANLFDALPQVIQEDFQEAGRCFVLGQDMAGVMLAMQAAEATIRETCFRLTTIEPGGDDTWAKLIQTLKQKRLEPSLMNRLDKVRGERNSLVHPPDKHSIQARTTPSIAEGYFNNAIGVARELVKVWQKENKMLSIYLARPNEMNLDLIGALWLLQGYGGGIGRIVDASSRTGDDMGKFEQLLGFGSKPEARTLAEDLGVEEEHALMLSWCDRWQGGMTVVPPKGGSITLSEILKSFAREHEEITERYRNALKVVDYALSEGIDLCSEDIAGQLGRKDINYYVIQARWERGEKAGGFAAFQSSYQEKGNTKNVFVAYLEEQFEDFLAQYWKIKEYRVIGFSDEREKFVVWCEPDPKALRSKLTNLVGRENYTMTKTGNRHVFRSAPNKAIPLPVARLWEAICDVFVR